MLVRKRLRWQRIVATSSGFLTYIVSWSTTIYVIHWFEERGAFGDSSLLGLFHIPFPLVGILSTALAIFLAFRNNSAYDRWWEARKIWGGIVNISRTIGRQVTAFAMLSERPEEERNAFAREIVYRHIAWMNALRLQLRREESWEEIEPFVEKSEFDWLMQRRNIATQLVQKQGQRFSEARQQGLITESRYHEMLDESLTVLYDLQGKAERIKNTPLPRQYDYFPRVFMFLFVTLLPSAMMTELMKVDTEWLVIPLTTAVSFMFYVLMRVGEFNEDPFERRHSDTPMTALCRTIEIDLREQLGETSDSIPEKLEPVDGILM